ncbi:MAG: hypothetical protein M3T96_02420 [Acidobacteriota bacterium]|nr:hypothetical protein [Acidobacteriota bacterium]
MTKEMLSKNVEAEQVETAIDLHDDGRFDLLIGSYCCYDSSQCAGTNNFQIINSKWKYPGGSEPS